MSETEKFIEILRRWDKDAYYTSEQALEDARALLSVPTSQPSEPHRHTDACYLPGPETEGSGEYLHCEKIVGQPSEGLRERIKPLICSCTLSAENCPRVQRVMELLEAELSPLRELVSRWPHYQIPGKFECASWCRRCEIGAALDRMGR